MANKLITTRIKNKVDTYKNWAAATGTLLDGEIALIRVPTGETYTNPVTGQNEPAWELLMKVGDGSTPFVDLPWMSAKASDVYDWAKMPTAESIPFVMTDGTTATSGKTLRELLELINNKAITNASNISAVSSKVDVTKVSTAISSAIDTLKAGLKHSGTKGTNQIVKAVTQSNGAVTVTYGTITAAELPSASTSAAGIVQLSDAIDSNVSTTAATSKAVKTAYDKAAAAAADAASRATGTHVHGNVNNNGTISSTAVTAATGVLVYDSSNKIQRTTAANARSIIGAAESGHNHDAKYVKFDAAYTLTDAQKSQARTNIDAASHTAVFGTDGLKSKVDKNTSDIADLTNTVSRGVNFRGEVASAPSGTTYTLKGETAAKTALVGDIVICGEKEYIYTAASTWKELGDLSRVTTIENWHPNTTADTAYTKVTVDAHGHVKSGSNPTTLTGYGITDAYTKSDVYTKSEVNSELAKKSDSGHTHDNYVNQNAFSKIAVTNQTTVEADSATDTVTFAGSNVSITTNASNDTVTFTVADGATSTAGIVKLSDATDGTANAASGKTAATPAAVKAAYDKAAAAAADAASRATGTHIHGNIANDGTLSTASRVVVTDGNKKVTTASIDTTKLGYLTDVTSNIQAQLNGKAASSHGTHVTYGGDGSATTVSRSDHTHSGYASRLSSIESTYAKFNNTDSKLYIGTDEIIFDCGGAPIN